MSILKIINTENSQLHNFLAQYVFKTRYQVIAVNCIVQPLKYSTDLSFSMNIFLKLSKRTSMAVLYSLVYNKYTIEACVLL